MDLYGGWKISNPKYPYQLSENPFRHAIPSPDAKAAEVLGGKLWREAKQTLVNMIQETQKCIHSDKKDFALSTLIGQTGSGKTHLLLNIKTSLDENEFATFYIDLTSYPSNRIGPLLGKIISHWSDDILKGLKQKIVEKLKKKAERGNKVAEKALLGGAFGKFSFMLNQKNFKEITSKILDKKRTLNFNALEELGILPPSVLKFLRTENEEILVRGFENGELGVEQFKFLTSLLKTRKLGVIMFDELGGITCESKRRLLNGLKGLINQRPPLVLIIAGTPGSLTDLEEIDPPLTRRIAKPRVRCDINAPRSYEEVFDVIKAYFEEFNSIFPKKDSKMLKFTVRELFRHGMKTLGDLLPVVSNALEESRGKEKITTKSIERALKNTRLHINSPKSEVNAPIRENLRISTKLSKTPKELSEKLVRSIRELTFQAGKLGKLSYLHPDSRKVSIGKNGEDVQTDVYLEKDGEKICLNVKLSNDGFISPQMARDSIKIAEKGKISGNSIDRAILLSNRGCSQSVQNLPKLEAHTLKKNEIVDLIYLANERIKEGAEQLEDKIDHFLRKIGIDD